MEKEFEKAKYTMLFSDYLEVDSEWYNKNIKMSTDARTTALRKALEAMWGVYEISGETVGEMRTFLLNTLNEHIDYYEDMIDNYDKEYDYTTGMTRENETVNKNLSVELPNKKISEEDIYAYPDSADKSETTVKSTDNSLFLALKQRYLRQIRNLYNEFARRFFDCFIHIY